MKLKKQDHPYDPPDNLFYQKKYWAIHEAVFELIGWPKFNLWMGLTSHLPSEIQQDRPFFYLPYGREFHPQEYGKNFYNVYSELKLSIENGFIDAHHHYLMDGIVWLVSPQDILLWAIHKDIYFSDKLQKSSGVYLIDVKIKKAILNKIKNKIIAQFLLFENPIRSVHALATDDLIIKFGTGNHIRDPTAIVRNINELYPEGGQSGVKLRPANIPKVIQEIKQTDSDGMIRYNIPLLKTTLHLIVHLFLYRKLNFSKSDKKSVKKIIETLNLEEFLNLEIVGLYINEAPELIKHVSIQYCKKLLIDYVRWSSPFIDQLKVAWQAYHVNEK